MDKKLSNWIQEKNLNCLKVSDNVFEIQDFGKFLLIQPKEDLLIGEEFDLLLSEEEYEIVDKDQIKYFLFEFGDRYYYSPLVKEKNKYNETFFKPKFLDFRNIGKCRESYGEDFVHLGIHSEYELLNGSGDPSDWVNKAVFFGHKCISICDRNTLAGTLPIQLACDKKGIKSILGETIVVAYNFNENDKYHNLFELKLYVKNYNGWRNLLRINKAINVDYKGFIPEELLLSYTEGLILVFSKESILFSELDKKQFLKIVLKYKESFENIFYQIDSVEWESDKEDVKHLNMLKNYINNFSNVIPPIVINDSYYINQEDNHVKYYLNSISSIVSNMSIDQYYKTKKETRDKFLPLTNANPKALKVIDAGLENTKIVEKLCNFKIETGKHKLPKFEVEDNVTLFYDLLQEGVEIKLKKIKQTDIYIERLQKECNVIVNAGFIDYFLILWDIVKWAKSKGIVVGPGRGSVGGSLIAYLLDITDVDPVANDLLFERFLNEARLSGERAKAADSMPDVDLDFQSDGRDAVKDYIEEKYSKHNSCSIGSYTRMKLKSALKNFSRIKGLDFKAVNYITKKIPNALEYTWDDLFINSINDKQIKNFLQRNSSLINEIKCILDNASVASIHPSAVLIFPKEDEKGNSMTVYDWLPVKEIEGKLVSEWEGKYVERAGFLKEDILGLSQLDKFKYILQLIKDNKDEEIILSDIDLNCKKTFSYFSKGYNEDVFQFSSSGLKSYSIKVKPDNIEDIVAMNALYRPGPMDSNAHNDFSDIKHGIKKPQFDRKLKEVTEKTFGLYIYQEQIMRAANVLGKLTLVESDEMRTAIKKFDSEKMKSFEERFVKGAMENGCDKKEAEGIWKKLMAFSGYGFNRSHSFAYGIIAYWSQWFKANYPLEFWTSSLYFAKEEDIPNRISEMKKVNEEIRILPPDVNEGGDNFKSSNELNAIFWSILKIKNVGEIAVQNILETRKSGKFTSFVNFIERVPKNKVNKKVIVSLIVAGCFDLLENIEKASSRKDLLIKFYSMNKEEIPEIYNGKDSNKDYYWILLQKQLTGLGDIDYKILVHKASKDIKFKKDYIEYDDFTKNKKEYKECTVAGRLISAYERNSSNGKYFKITIENNNNPIIIMMWNLQYEEYKEEIPKLINSLIAISGKIRSWNNSNSLHTYEDTKLIVL